MKKKIEGYCKIELKDVKTGRIESEEHHNLVTKALAYFYKNGGWTNPTAINATMRTQALKYLMGGLMCFDSAFTESDEVVRVPAAFKMTANGAVDVLNTGAPTELGSWNETESGWQQDGSYKMVWDWTTSQGNGTIAGICLTSLYNGMMGFGSHSLGRKANPYNNGLYNSITEKATADGFVVGYDANKIYIIDSDFTNKTNININVYKFPFSAVDIRNTTDAELVETITLELPAIMQGLTGGMGWSGVCSYVKNGIGYLAVTQYFEYNNQRGSDAFVLKFDRANRSISAVEVNKTAEYGNVRFTGISDKYVVLGLHAVEFDNQVNEIDITDGANEYQYFAQSVHGVLYAIDSEIFYGASNTGGHIINITDESMLPTNGSGAWNIAGFVDAAHPLHGYYNRGVYRDPRYVATIYNLNSPITKTADKTMKVTYVLRFTSN